MAQAIEVNTDRSIIEFFARNMAILIKEARTNIANSMLLEEGLFFFICIAKTEEECIIPYGPDTKNGNIRISP